MLKVLDPTRKTQSRLHAEIAHASIAAIVCMRLFACVCICVRLRVLFAIECVRSHLRACEVHLIKEHQIKLRAHAHIYTYIHVHVRTYIYTENARALDKIYNNDYNYIRTSVSVVIGSHINVSRL